MRYSEDLRLSVLHYVEQGGRKSEASRIFGVCRYTIYKWIKLKRETGSLSPRPLSRSFRKLDPASLARRVEAYPDATLKDHAGHFGVSFQSISRVLKTLGITRKKRPVCTKSGMPRSDGYIWSK